MDVLWIVDSSIIQCITCSMKVAHPLALALHESCFRSGGCFPTLDEQPKAEWPASLMYFVFDSRTQVPWYNGTEFRPTPLRRPELEQSFCVASSQSFNLLVLLNVVFKLYQLWS